MAEALRLADALTQPTYPDWVMHIPAPWHPPAQETREAAAELRRLHEAHDWQYKMAGERLRRIEKLEAQRDALLEALLRIESAVDWYLGRSSFTQTTQLKGLKHSANVRKELFAAHDEVRAAIALVEGRVKSVEEGK